jgi:type I restriction enzyme R subunit
LTLDDVWRLGDDFQHTQRGYVDYLMLDERGFPFIVLEAKSESKDPLDGKEQARRYAKSQNCRFVILSNGNLHYFWDLERGNPYIITKFPTQTSILGYQRNRSTTAGRRSAVNICIYPHDDYITVNESQLARNPAD